MRMAYKVGIGVGALMLAGSGVAWGAIPDSDDGEIHGCRQPVTGNLRVVDAEGGVSCHSSEDELVWNQEGPAGPQGSAGPTGPQGPAGPQLTTYVKTATGSAAPSGSPTAELDCNSGDKLYSASARRNESGSTDGFAPTTYQVNGSGEPIGANYDFGGGMPYRIDLICVDLP